MKGTNLGKGLTMISQLGITMVTPILICVFIGVFLDEWSHKSPLFTVIFIILGTAAAFRNMFYHTMREAKRNEKNRKEEQDE